MSVIVNVGIVQTVRLTMFENVVIPMLLKTVN